MTMRTVAALLLVTALVTGLIGGVTADESYDITVENGEVSIPERTEPIAGYEFTVDSIAPISEGEPLDVTTTAPAGDFYFANLYDSSQDLIVDTTLRGPNSTSFDTAALDLDPGTYAVAIVAGGPEAIQPVVIEAYQMSLSASGSVEQGANITADITLDGADPEPASVDVIIANESINQTTTAQKVTDQTYEAEIPADYAPGEYRLYAVARETTSGSTTDVQDILSMSDENTIKITESAADTGNDADSSVDDDVVADVEVTTDVTSLTADGETTANVTLHLVDSNGNAVPRETTTSPISWSIDNKQNAGVERVSADTDTDASGQATLTVTANTVDETFTVTGTDGANNNADSVDISTSGPANFTLDLVDGPTTITQNESYSATPEVTNEGDAAGTHTIEYDLEDSTGISQIDASKEVSLDAGNSTEITFEVPASATADLEASNYTHVFASDDGELTVDAEVVEDGADETALARFDSGDDGMIDRDEAVSVIVAYNTDGTIGGEPVTRDQAVNVIIAYNTGASV